MGNFKEFIGCAKILPTAIGLLLALAISACVTSLVNDVITPGALTPVLTAAGVDSIENWAVGKVKIGKFISSFITFLLTALVLYFLVKLAQKITPMDMCK